MSIAHAGLGVGCMPNARNHRDPLAVLSWCAVSGSGFCMPTAPALSRWMGSSWPVSGHHGVPVGSSNPRKEAPICTFTLAKLSSGFHSPLISIKLGLKSSYNSSFQLISESGSDKLNRCCHREIMGYRGVSTLPYVVPREYRFIPW